ncbi:hypothetical protein AB7M29_000071 [Pseudomonas sp. F-14 TE3623]
MTVLLFLVTEDQADVLGPPKRIRGQASLQVVSHAFQVNDIKP